MFMIKKMYEDTRVYREKQEWMEYEPDNMTKHIIEDWMQNGYEMDYFEDEQELITWVNVAMDKWTEIIVIPAKEVLDSPIKKWYFFY